MAFSVVHGHYVPDFLFHDDFCPLRPSGQAQGHIASLLRDWHTDASGGHLTAVLKALLDRLAIVPVKARKTEVSAIAFTAN